MPGAITPLQASPETPALVFPARPARVVVAREPEPPPPDPVQVRKKAKRKRQLRRWGFWVMIGWNIIGGTAGLLVLKKKLDAARALEAQVSREIPMSEMRTTLPKLTPPPADQVTESDAANFGLELGRLLSFPAGPDLLRVTDYPAYSQRTLDGFKMPSSMLGQLNDQFIEGSKTQPGGIFSQLAGIPTRFLSTRMRDGFPSLLFRQLPPGCDPAYVEVLLHPRGTGLAVVDYYHHLTGQYASEGARTLLLPSLLASDPACLPDADPLRRATAAQTTSVQLFIKAVSGQDQARAALAWKDLSDELRTLPALESLFLISSRAATDPARVRESLSLISHAKDRGLLAFELFLIDEDFPAATHCLDQLETAVGRDPAILLTRARLLGLQGKRAESAATLARLRQLEPELLPKGASVSVSQ